MTSPNQSPDQQPVRWPVRQLLGLSGVLAVVWIVLAVPIVIYSGSAGLEGLCWAVILCLVPGCLVVGLQEIVPSMSAAPHAVMLATVVRMLFVTGGVVLLRAIRPELLTMEFVACLVISYLAALAAESYYLLRLVNPVPESTQEPN
jgi:hypothetical protein